MLLKECINVYKAFQTISESQLPLVTGWTIAQNMSKLQPLVESFEEHRQTYIEQLRTKATVDSNGDPEIADEDAADFKKQVEALLNEDEKVRLKKVELIDDGTLSIAPNVLMAAMDFLTLKPHADKVI
tara:strand:+ start:1301 stop:1684 length:384 start_codon:yes stop_codon:yes gene_type:complete